MSKSLINTKKISTAVKEYTKRWRQGGKRTKRNKKQADPRSKGFSGLRPTAFATQLNSFPSQLSNERITIVSIFVNKIKKFVYVCSFAK